VAGCSHLVEREQKPDETPSSIFELIGDNIMKALTILFAATLYLLPAASVSAQTGSSRYEPSIASLTFECVVPLGSITGADILFQGASDSFDGGTTVGPIRNA
jgi:hypothetical protein